MRACLQVTRVVVPELCQRGGGVCEKRARQPKVWLQCMPVVCRKSCVSMKEEERGWAHVVGRCERIHAAFNRIRYAEEE